MTTGFEITIPNLPFCMGPLPVPKNPDNIPNTLSLSLKINTRLGRLEQIVTSELSEKLTKVYTLGNQMGTPSDDTKLGRPYAEDFVNFIDRFSTSEGKLLEIGSGSGYLGKCLADRGWEYTGIEPGRGYEKQWNKFGVNIINDFFPSKKIRGKFDVIVFYTVLEHILDTQNFLEEVKQFLNPDGIIFLAVPDCGEELFSFDPSILLHEHLHYFSNESLNNTLIDAGLTAIVESSKFGRSLYACAKLLNGEISISQQSILVDKIKKFLHHTPITIDNIKKTIRGWGEKGSVGIFAPARLLNCMPQDIEMQFFDDDRNLHKKFYPPFQYSINGRDRLLLEQPNYLLIGSRTFGTKIKDQLLREGVNSKIFLIGDLL